VAEITNTWNVVTQHTLLDIGSTLTLGCAVQNTFRISDMRTCKDTATCRPFNLRPQGTYHQRQTDSQWRSTSNQPYQKTEAEHWNVGGKSKRSSFKMTGTYELQLISRSVQRNAHPLSTEPSRGFLAAIVLSSQCASHRLCRYFGGPSGRWARALVLEGEGPCKLNLQSPAMQGVQCSHSTFSAGTGSAGMRFFLALIGQHYYGPWTSCPCLAVLAGTKVKAADEAGSHHIHTHLAKVPRPAEKSSADEEMMQVGASSSTCLQT